MTQSSTPPAAQAPVQFQRLTEGEVLAMEARFDHETRQSIVDAIKAAPRLVICPGPRQQLEQPR